MNDPAVSQGTAAEGDPGGALYKKEFWSEENLKYVKPHYRMEKVSRLVNKMAGAKACTLLDVGCAGYPKVPALAQYRVLRHRYRHP